MKSIFSLFVLLTCMSLSSIAEEKKKLYKWVDENGNVHYTDEPRKGAKEITIKEVPAIKMNMPKVPAYNSDTGGDSQTQSNRGYENLILTEPQDDGVIRNNASAVTLTAQITPELKPDHSIRFFLDGKPVSEDPKALTVTVTEVNYGLHSANFVILNKQGKQIKASKTNKFHLLNLIKRNN